MTKTFAKRKNGSTGGRIALAAKKNDFFKNQSIFNVSASVIRPVNLFCQFSRTKLIISKVCVGKNWG